MRGVDAKAGLWGNALIALAVPLSFWLAGVLPPETGWENGGIEGFQNVFLGACALVSVVCARRLSRPADRALIWVAALFWLVFMGREMSWGAVFLQPSSFSEEVGPIWSSRTLLWYRPAVPYVVGALLLLAIGWMVRFKAWRPIAELTRQRRLPMLALMFFVGCFVLASLAEGKGGLALEAHYGRGAVVLEELLETLGYLALMLGQMQVYWALRARRS